MDFRHQCSILLLHKSKFLNEKNSSKLCNREMIEYLIKKLQGEEQQRLRTEIQSSRMISSLEKVIQQLVKKFLINKKT